MEKEKPGQAVCPYDPHHNSTAIYVGKCVFIKYSLQTYFIYLKLTNTNQESTRI